MKKIFYQNDVEEILSILKKERIFGIKIFTINGCFDLLTRGHIHILKKAREFSEDPFYCFENGIVVCGLNSDKSIRKLKGKFRPILNQEERAEIILETGFIDYVYIYDDKTSENFVRLFKPNFHINDRSYGENCLETKVFKEYENKIKTELLLVDKINSLSTSNIVDRILKIFLKNEK